MEDIQITGVQQKSLGGKQSLASNLEGARSCSIGRIGGSGIFLKGNKDLVLNNTARRCSAEGLISSPLTAIFGARGTPEAIQLLPLELFISRFLRFAIP
jgi:hypothetical protein